MAKLGRPPKLTPKSGDRVPLSLRVTAETKAVLDQAAASSGRSQSQEAELRIEKSFHEQRLLYDALELSYGEQLAGLLLAMGNSMKVCASVADVMGMSWTDQPAAYEMMETSARTILEAFRPLAMSARPIPEDLQKVFNGRGVAQSNGYLDLLDRPRADLAPSLKKKLAIEREMLGHLLNRLASDDARSKRDKNSSERDEAEISDADGGPPQEQV